MEPVHTNGRNCRRAGAFSVVAPATFSAPVSASDDALTPANSAAPDTLSVVAATSASVDAPVTASVPPLESAFATVTVVNVGFSGNGPATGGYGTPLIVDTPKEGRKCFTGKTHMPSPSKVRWVVNVNILNNAKHHYDMVKNVDPNTPELSFRLRSV